MNNQKRDLLLPIIISLFFALGYGQGYDNVEEFMWDFAEPGFDKNKTYIGYGKDFTVRSNDGAFVLKQLDINVPGRNGLDLMLNRIYNSKVFNHYHYTVIDEPCTTSCLNHDRHKKHDLGLGPGWTMGFPRFGWNFGGVKTSGVEIGWPSIQWTDGSVERMFEDRHMTNGSTFYYTTNSFKRLRTSFGWPSFKNPTITTNDGTQYYLGHEYERISGNQYGKEYYCTMVTDKYGNSISIQYHTNTNLISKITDTIGREYDFYLTTDGLHYDYIEYNINSTEKVKIQFDYYTNKGYQYDTILKNVKYIKNTQELNFGSHFEYNDFLEMTNYEFATGGNVATTYDFIFMRDKPSLPASLGPRGVKTTTMSDGAVTIYDYNTSGDDAKAFRVLNNNETTPVYLDFFNTTKVTYPDNSFTILKYEIGEAGYQLWRGGQLREIEEYKAGDTSPVRKTYKTYFDAKLIPSTNKYEYEVMGMVSWPTGEVIKDMSLGDLKIYYKSYRLNTGSYYWSIPPNQAGWNLYNGEVEGYNVFGKSQYIKDFGEISSFNLTYNLQNSVGRPVDNIDETDNVDDNKLVKKSYNETYVNHTEILNQVLTYSFRHVDLNDIETEKLKSIYTYFTNGNMSSSKTYDPAQYDPIEPHTYKLTNYTEDATNGNVTRVTRNTGWSTEHKIFTYDAQYNNAYVTKNTNKGINATPILEKKYTYNYYTGSVESSTNSNGDITYYDFDDLGRLTKIWNPDDITTDPPTQEIIYEDYNGDDLLFNRIQVKRKNTSSEYLNTQYLLYDNIGRLSQSQQINDSLIVNTLKKVSASVGEGTGSNPDVDTKYFYIDYNQVIDWDCSIWEQDELVSSTFELYQNDVRRVWKKSNGTYSGSLQVNQGDVCRIVARVSAKAEYEGSSDGDVSYDRYEEIILQAFEYDHKGNLKYESNIFGVNGSPETIGDPIADVWNLHGAVKTEYNYDYSDRITDIIYPDNSTTSKLYGAKFEVSTDENGTDTKTIFDAYFRFPL